jgi:hypothetical protein
MTDRITKVLLGLIASGLWANFAASQIRPARAQDLDLVLGNIESYVEKIATGTCTNFKICR